MYLITPKYDIKIEIIDINIEKNVNRRIVVFFITFIYKKGFFT